LGAKRLTICGRERCLSRASYVNVTDRFHELRTQLAVLLAKKELMLSNRGERMEYRQTLCVFAMIQETGHALVEGL